MISKLQNIQLNYGGKNIHNKMPIFKQSLKKTGEIDSSTKSLLEKSCYMQMGTYDTERVLDLYRNVDVIRNKTPKIFKEAQKEYKVAQEEIKPIFNMPNKENEYTLYDYGNGYITRESEDEASLTLTNKSGFMKKKIIFNPENNEISFIRSQKYGFFPFNNRIYVKTMEFENGKLKKYSNAYWNKNNLDQKEFQCEYKNDLLNKYREVVSNNNSHTFKENSCTVNRFGQITSCYFK